MAVNKSLDSKKAQGLRGKFNRRFASGVNDRTVFGLYIRNLDLPSMEAVFLGAMAGVIGFFGAGICYDELEHKDLDTEMHYELSQTQNSYQGIGETLIQRTAEGQYAVYAPEIDGDGDFAYEYDYLERSGDALGALYNIRDDLRAISQRIQDGVPLSEEQQTLFFSLTGLTTLHEEEAGTIEREVSELIRYNTDATSMAAKIEQIMPFVDEAIENIYENNQYGLSQDMLTNIPDTVSVDEAMGKGAITALMGYMALLLSSSWLGARRETKRQMSRARENKTHKLQPY